MSDDQHGNPPSAPKNVGPYRIAGRLGVGGMGEVYRARDERLERWVAIKHIRPGEADGRARERLRREARAVASLSHPSIVQVHDIVENEDGDWVVMELVEGRTLQELIDDRAVEIPKVLTLAREIAEGLAEAHAKGIIHRDLKTENVMVTPSDHAKILDFGLAKRLWQGRNDASLSVQGAILGTGRAMSPEQVLGEEVDHRSDLFSFGTLLYETLTGRRPFVGSSLIITLAQVCTEEQPFVHELNPEVPAELSELVDRLLQKDPLQRPQSAGEVVEAIERIRRPETAPLDGVGANDPSDTAVAPPVVPQASPRPQRIEPSSRSFDPSLGGSRSSSSRPTESTAGIFIKTLVQLMLVDDGSLGDSTGDARIYEIYTRHDRLARDLLTEYDGLEIHKSDGFLFLFERPVEAVELVLAYHRRLADLGAELGVELKARAGIHLSEIFLRENAPDDIHRGAKPVEVEGVAKLVVASLASLAEGGHTLLTQEARDMTRRALVGHRLSEEVLHWKFHGRYLLAGIDETVRIYEVSAAPIPVDQPPLESTEARRVEERASDAEKGAGRQMYLGLAAVLLLAVMATVYFVFEGNGSPLLPSTANPPSDEAIPAAAGMDHEASAPVREADRPSLAVLGFRTLPPGSQELGWLSTALAETMSTMLLGEGQGDLRVIPGESVARLDLKISTNALAPDTLVRIQEKISADYVILGTIFNLDEAGEQLSVQMTIQDTRNQETIGTISEIGSRSTIIEISSKAVRQVRDFLDLAQISNEGVLAARATLSEDSGANQSYFRGLEKQRSFNALGARDAFLEAVQIDPEFAVAHAQLANTWLVIGHDKKAEASARRAYDIVREKSDEFSLRDKLEIESNYYETAGNWDRAISSQKALWEGYPNQLDYGLRLADIQVNAELAEEAMETIEELRRLSGSSRYDPRIDLAEATAAYMLRDHSRVLESVRRAIQKGDEQGFKSLVAEAQRFRGRAFTRKRKPEEARQALEASREIFVGLGDKQGVARVLHDLARLETAERNTSRAEELMQQSLDIFSETGSRREIARVQNALGYFNERKGHLKEARALLEEALAVHEELGYEEEEALTLDTLLWVVVQSGDVNRAEKLGHRLVNLSREIRSDSLEAGGYYALGMTALASGQVTEADLMLEKSLNLARVREDQEPFFQELLSLGLSALGTLRLFQGEPQQAKAFFDQYWERQEDLGEWGEQAVTEYFYADVLLELGEVAEAEEWAIRIAESFLASEAKDYTAVSLANVARIQWLQGRLDEADENLKKAVEMGAESDIADVRFRIAATQALLTASQDFNQATDSLRFYIGQARDLNLHTAELEMRLVLGRIGVELGPSPEQRAHGRALLEPIVEEARGLGMGWLRERALAAMESGEPPVSRAPAPSS